MLTLQVFIPEAALPAALEVLTTRSGVTHTIEAGRSPRRDLTLVSAEVDPSVVDRLLPDLAACGIAAEELEIVHRDSNRPLASSRVTSTSPWGGGALAWSELAITSHQYARAVPRYLLFMVCAGVIAMFGILNRG